MSDDAVLRALLAARVPPTFAELHAYVPDGTVVPVRLDANEAPALLPTLDAEERRAWNEALAAVEPARYPDVRAKALRAHFAQENKVDPESLVIGCGSDEVIAMLLATLAKPLDGRPPSILVPTPTFVMYRVSARVHGYDVREVPLDASCDLDEPAMTTAIRETRPAMVFLATPNNPTSASYSREKVERLVRVAAENDPPTLVVVDEAYLAFRLGPATERSEIDRAAKVAKQPLAKRDAPDPWGGFTGLDLQRDHANVVVLRTLSKIGLAALRVGYAIAHPLLSRELEKSRLPYDLPAHSQAGALVALTSLAPAIERHVASIVRARSTLAEALAKRGLVHARADANFFWLTQKGAAAVHAGLRARGVLVRAFAPYPDRLRVTVGASAENERFLTELDALRATLRDA